jgi:hypothetical protein
MALHIEQPTAQPSGLIAILDPEKHQQDDTESNGDPIVGSHKNIDGGVIIDHAAERRLVRKLDLYIIPPTMFLYLFSFLDR